MISNAGYLRGMISNNQNLMELKPCVSWTLTHESSTGCAGRDGQTPVFGSQSALTATSAGPALSKITGESVTCGGTVK